MSRKNDKKNRLIQAAYQLFREKSYYGTTLAMIAEAADVPLGNIYYYFKFKESLLNTVLSRLIQDLQKNLNQFNERPTQKERIKAFIQHISDNAVDLAKYGDPILGLAKELRFEYAELNENIALSMQHTCKWFSQQFLGLATDPQTQAHCLLQRIYGIIAIASSLNSPQYIIDHCERIISEL